MFFPRAEYHTLPGEENYNALQQAIREYQLQEIKKLLAIGTKPECPRWQSANRTSCLASLVASRNWSDDNERIAMFDKLVKKGANPYFIWDNGNTLLHVAALGRNIKMITHLLENYHFDINAVCNFGCSALYEAAWFAGKEIVALLLSHGANPLLANKCGSKPSDKARNSETKQLLLAKEREWLTQHATDDLQPSKDTSDEYTPLLRPPGGI